jgi:hypothetical protein
VSSEFLLLLGRKLFLDLWKELTSKALCIPVVPGFILFRVLGNDLGEDKR